ncbi:MULTISPECIES: GNAT family N-acetyltransferase [Streptomyces]|uniref:GNAT family N-acetyltransferase n=1 Tax=Streptomyces coelicolor (strain ATCC BAA-471 / A3(2) / M145) TaxID=100226 RepID=Q93IX7_STRCO|nr:MULTISPECIES: GNAT family N-acetyltransferase [Streptomyces]MDX2923419.1 GNAT family N-acetyltransferase [Streptomyces sp. NRRL_B-16638]MYU40818.1 GNAT family N-acetyltransferase [Streptomyces sp. SID7813]NSL80747.1 GNAT family N-acetyltransferase [Streptomyces coelicolor]QFI41513.1 GNAT family N-acetyltransferase [Streptomyces coelicolor A3(2)]QKN65163.1 GNAT family N-acetyltransferase [Streptomyces coelicolor]
MSDVTDAVARLVDHGPTVPALVLASLAALIATAGFHTRWSRRHGQAPPADDTGARPPTAERPAGTGPAGSEPGGSEPCGSGAGGESALWRMRTTVRDAPGSLAVLCAALADRRIDILSLQTHPLTEGTVDEFLLRAPGELSAAELAEVVTTAGGARTWTERADAHDLVDAPTRVLGLAARTALDAAELPLALRQLLGRCTIRSLPAPADDGAGARAAAAVPPEGALEDTVLRLRAPEGGVISVERPHLPFTPAEFARARALVELDARLGPRVPRGRDVLTLPEGSDITVRRADTRDVPAAKAMHERCSARTLGMRYHGPVGDADRYLNHLLSPRFGRTLAVQTASGRLVGLGHLLWDGDETEVALLVEDGWQRRGIGGELLARLVAMAADAGCESVYAITQASNTGMVAAMRGLSLPLDYQIEEGTLVVTARLDPAAQAAARLPQAERIGRE